AASQLRDASELTDSCYGFPDDNFNGTNCIKCTYGTSPHIVLDAGAAAIDFTLYDLDGAAWTLSEHLASQPVCLIWGMHTCPAFEGLGTASPFDECAYWDEAALVAAYGGSGGGVAFAHLVGPEPHPITPDTNFDSGVVKVNFWSTVAQARTYDARVAMARAVADKVHPNAALLPDLLPDAPYGDGDAAAAAQPVWCSYAHGARTAVLIGTDGVVRLAQTWFHAGDMAAAIEALL
ncbi:hypothetical protein JKP88DRAFT_155418, partial [Tribonema minus]